MKKVLVIGGSGFLGSHVADLLTQKKFKVTIFDIKKSPWIKNDQKIILGDILDKKKLNQAISKSDIIYNFAGMADLNEALTKPMQTANLNIMGNLNVMEACIKYKIKKFVFASTVYVNSDEGGYYRCSKIASEEYLKEFGKTEGLNYTILRYGSLYGPRSDKNNGMYKILYEAVKNNRVIYKGHPETIREYIHVLDAAESSVMVLNKEFNNQILTLTGQQTIKVAEILKIICEILDIPEKKIRIIQEKQHGHYIRTPYAYREKFNKKLVPNRYIDIGEGILEIIKSLK